MTIKSYQILTSKPNACVATAEEGIHIAYRLAFCFSLEKHSWEVWHRDKIKPKSYRLDSAEANPRAISIHCALERGI